MVIAVAMAVGVVARANVSMEGGDYVTDGNLVIVQADAGAMGGSASEEFLAIAANGEDTFVRSPGGYAANVEAVTTPVPDPVPFDDAPAAHVRATRRQPGRRPGPLR